MPVPRQLRPENDGKGHSGRQGLETSDDGYLAHTCSAAELAEIAEQVFLFGYLLILFFLCFKCSFAVAKPADLTNSC